MNLFLDCGSNIGQGFKQFSKRYGTSEFTYYLFEPNPYCFAELEKNLSNLSYVKLHNCAVGNSNTELEFYYKQDFDQGGTLVFDHGNSLFNNADSNLIKVKCIDLNEYVESVEKDFDKIVIKLDVESAEYDILEKFIQTGLIKRFDKLFIEFHAHYMEGDARNKYQSREKNIIDYMIDNKINYKLWK